MTKRAIRMPVELSTSTKVGPRLFRKTVLRSGQIRKGGFEIDVTPGYLKGLADNFAAGVMDNVPLVIGHPGMDDVEKTRGRLAGLEVAGDELVGTFETDENSAALLSKHPYIGCSVAIDPEFARADGRKAGATLVHVGMHNDPEVSKLGDWVPLGSEYDEVVDLTDPAQTLADPGVGTKEKEAPVAFTDEQLKEALLKIMKGDGGESSGAEDKNESVDIEAMLRKLVSEAVAEKTADGASEDELDDIAEPAEEEAPAGETERELVAAGKDEAAQLLLANQELEIRLARVERQRNDERFASEKLELAKSFGIPLDITEKLKPVLYGEGHLVTLGNDKKVNAGELVRDALRELGRRYAKHLDLGHEIGSAEALDDQKRSDQELSDFVARAHAQFGTGRSADNK